MKLLKTKFHIPAFNAKSLVSRPRIHQTIEDTCRLVVVSAPAGFGKTTWLSQWAASCDTPVAWVSLEKNDDSQAVFWTYVITALSSVLNDCGRVALGQIRSSANPAMETILAGLINEIAELDRSATLVLDDCHLITDPRIYAGMDFLMDHLPTNLRLVIAGRETPKLGLSKFRLSGRLVEIKPDDLRFQDEEARKLLNTVHALELTERDVALLRSKTEGWAAGLMLAVLSMRDRENRRDFIDDFTGSHRLVLDYLLEEVVSGLTLEDRDFLMALSVPDRFCPDLAVALTGRVDAGERIDGMERNNLFVIPLDDKREWYRFHHLFRDFLAGTLKKEGGKDIAVLHHRAFAWFRKNAFYAEAFDHGILSGDNTAAADLLAENAPSLVSESGGFILAQRIERLPEDIGRSHPDLCGYWVMLRAMAGSFDDVALLYQACFDGNPTIEGFRSLIRSYDYFYREGAFEKAIAEIPVMMDQMPVRHEAMREIGDLLLCLSLRYSGEIDRAYARMNTLDWEDDLPVLKAITYVDILLAMGKTDSTLDFIDRSLSWGKARYGRDLIPEYGYLYIQRCSVLREKNRLDEALADCRRGLYLGRNNEYIECIFLGHMEYARTLAACGDFSEAVKAINRSRAAARSSSTWGLGLADAVRAGIELVRGNRRRAKEVLDAMGDFLFKDIPFFRTTGYLAYCRYCLALNDTGPVHEITDRMMDEDRETLRRARLLECCILKALALDRDGHRKKALAVLEEAFDLADGHVRIFLDEGKPMVALLAEALKRKTLPARLKPFLDAAGFEPRIARVHDFSEHFNDREIEILRLMKQGFSNTMIADTLYLSVHTVRWYASRMFAKLDVKRRGEAVVHAEKHGLI